MIQIPTLKWIGTTKSKVGESQKIMISVSYYCLLFYIWIDFTKKYLAVKQGSVQPNAQIVDRSQVRRD